MNGEVRLREDVIQGEDVRVAYTWLKVDVKGAPANSQPVLVQVAETLEKRKTLATEIVKGTMSMDSSALDLTSAFQPACSSAPNSTAHSTGQVRARVSGGKRGLCGGKGATPCPRQVVRQRRCGLVRVLREVVPEAQLHRVLRAGLGNEARGFLRRKNAALQLQAALGIR